MTALPLQPPTELKSQKTNYSSMPPSTDSSKNLRLSHDPEVSPTFALLVGQI